MTRPADTGRVEPATPPITVVMPTRNQAGFIERAIASVFSQGIAGLELCVQDGASTDGTPALLQLLAPSHPGLRWASEPDAGPADAVNRAVARARGAVIGWLNSDDLYTPGAVARALAHLARHPQHVMVYGEGEHIDASGARIGRYPTRDPATPLAAWADGCPICQATAVFRREAFLALGGLDTTLRTAFDYDLWLRFMKAHPGAIGMLGEVQAQSRLHAGAITLRLREQVALEGLQLVHRHIGPAPAHWLLTHFDEVMAGAPFDGHAEAPAVRLVKLVQRAQAWLAPGETDRLRDHLARHRGIQLATADCAVDLYADGWAAAVTEARLRVPAGGCAGLRLVGRHVAPTPAPLQLRAEAVGRPPLALSVAHGAGFDWLLPCADAAPGETFVWQIRCDNAVVPAETVAGSSDARALAFQLDGLRVQR